MFKRISKRKCAIARHRALALINNIQRLLKGKYKFSFRLVGSGAWNTIIEDENGEYDLDYQLILTTNSPIYKKLNDTFPKPTEIKNDFLKAFNKAKKDEEIFENSTTAITLVNKDRKPFHIDFVIIKTEQSANYIIRRNNKKETPSYNEFTWNELPKFNEAYSYFNGLPVNVKKYLIDKIIIPAKQKEKEKNENDTTKISSSELFIREVNNYKCHTKKK